jgi:hypothetical protein
MEKFLEFDIAIKNNFGTNDSDLIYILLQRRLDASCIIFNSQADRSKRLTISRGNSILPSYCALMASKYVSEC